MKIWPQQGEDWIYSTDKAALSPPRPLLGRDDAGEAEKGRRGNVLEGRGWAEIERWLVGQADRWGRWRRHEETGEAAAEGNPTGHRLADVWLAASTLLAQPNVRARSGSPVGGR